MQPLLFRAPGFDLPAAEALRRIAQALTSPPLERFGPFEVEGQPLRDGALLRAGVAVRIEVACAMPAWLDAPCDAVRTIVLRPPWRSGRLRTRDGRQIDYRVADARGELAELHVGGLDLSPRVVLATLAAADMPVLGDVLNGGSLIEGGMRFIPRGAETASAGPEEAAWWPDESPVVGASGDGSRGALARYAVSKETARVLRRGHPWVLPDGDSADPLAFARGSLVALADPGGADLGVARVDGAGATAARVWRLPDAAERSIEARVEHALTRRARLRERGPARLEDEGRPYTDALRLIHGEADGLPGVFVDRLGPMLRMIITSAGAERSLARRVGQAVARREGEGGAPPVLEVVHLRSAPGARHACVRWQASHEEIEVPLDDRGRFAVHERGLRFLVEPGLAEPDRPRPGVGLFLDQRENRHRLARRARRGRWLNLFAHTGAFSVALLAAGAEEVVSVDLSGAYLGWLDDNLALNAAAGVDAGRHRSVRRDGRRYLDEAPGGDGFAGIILDPPTAAAAGRRFWSTKKDLGPLIEGALRRLEPAGCLLVTRNHRRARGDLADLVRRSAARAGVDLAKVDPGDPGPDFPRLRGFPEGDSFRGVLAIRR